MKNPLINGIFHFATKDEHECLIPIEDFSEIDETKMTVENSECYLVCQLCLPTKAISGRRGFTVLDPDYKCTDTQENWFTALKKSIARHISSDLHLKEEDEHDKKLEEVGHEIDGIKETVRYLVYYLLKSNTAFLRFPELLAVANQCGLEIGNINHSRGFPAKILPFIDAVLLENTAEWFKDQDKVTLLLDHGTVFGLVMLVVYFVGEDGSVRLAGCTLTDSKEGDHTARLAYEVACTSNLFLPANDVLARVKVVCADGAIVDRNGPFKREMRAIFGPNLIFRWDVLHMMNRCHIAARGSTDVDIENDGSGNRRGRTLLAKTLVYIQNESKKWRSGIQYTRIALQSVDFMRPKVFSSTRMSLFEYE